ncbi:hypothetical protein AAXE64_07525 [Priestia megaterium]
MKEKLIEGSNYIIKTIYGETVKGRVKKKYPNMFGLYYMMETREGRKDVNSNHIDSVLEI